MTDDDVDEPDLEVPAGMEDIFEGLRDQLRDIREVLRPQIRGAFPADVGELHGSMSGTTITLVVQDSVHGHDSTHVQLTELARATPGVPPAVLYALSTLVTGALLVAFRDLPVSQLTVVHTSLVAWAAAEWSRR